MADERCPYSRFVAKNFSHLDSGTLKCMSLMRDGIGPRDGAYHHAGCDSHNHKKCYWFLETKKDLGEVVDGD